MSRKEGFLVLLCLHSIWKHICVYVRTYVIIGLLFHFWKRANQELLVGQSMTITCCGYYF